MAFYAPLGALSRGAGGFTEGLKEADERNARQFEMMGLQALGRAFMPDMGPQPPMPGQPSMPAGPPPGAGPQGPPQQWPPAQGPPQPPQASGDMFGGMGGRPVEMGAPPMGGPTPPMQPPPGSPSGMPGPAPGPSPGARAPPAGSPGSPPAGGMPQLDLQTLAQRIAAKNPNLPPQAMMAALMRAEPLLNHQAKNELAVLRAHQRQQAIDTQGRFADIKERGLTGKGGAEGPGLSPQGLDLAAELYFQTGKFPPNLRGEQGRKQQVQIQNRAVEQHPDTALNEWPTQWQKFGAQASGMRSLETRAAGLKLAESEASRLIPRVREISNKIDRTEYPTLNSLILAAQKKTGGTDVIKLGIAIQSLIPVYARVLKPVGQVGVTDTQNAQHLLEQAWSQGQIGAALEQMELELQSAKEALTEARETFATKPKPAAGGGDSKPAPAATTGTPVKSGGWTIERVGGE